MNRHLEGNTNMRDPELRSPQQWAEELREDASIANAHAAFFSARRLTSADCHELADCLDDLAEVLELLRVWLGPEPWKQPLSDAKALLAKYQEEQAQQPAPLARPAGAAEPVAGVFVLGAEQAERERDEARRDCEELRQLVNKSECRESEARADYEEATTAELAVLKAQEHIGLAYCHHMVDGSKRPHFEFRAPTDWVPTGNVPAKLYAAPVPPPEPSLLTLVAECLRKVDDAIDGDRAETIRELVLRLKRCVDGFIPLAQHEAIVAALKTQAVATDEMLEQARAEERERCYAAIRALGGEEE